MRGRVRQIAAPGAHAPSTTPVKPHAGDGAARGPIRFASPDSVWLGGVATAPAWQAPNPEPLVTYVLLGSMACWLLAGGADGWRPSIGDPDRAGWVIFVAYGVASFACYRAWRASSSAVLRPAFRSVDAARRDRRLGAWWLCLCLTMLALGINKQLDLQTLLIQVGRELAHRHGWHEARQSIKAAVVASLAVGCATLALAWMVALRSSLPRGGLSLAGVVVLAGFVVLRAAQLELMSALHVGHRLRSVLELSGIALVALDAHRSVRPRSERR